MNIWDQIKTEILHKGIYYLLVLFIAVGLKFFYSRAASEDLVWILSPTAAIVECLSGTHFEKEMNIGYVSLSRSITIVPACAGLNFMIAAFCMAAFGLLYSMKRRELLPLCVVASMAAAYLLTVAVNSVRIVTSMYLYKADIYTQLITPERVHRIEGVLIYVVFLSLFYLAVRKIMWATMLFATYEKKKTDGRNIRDAVITSLIPLFWYFLIALAVPVLNNAHHSHAGLFWEHFLVVLTVGLIIFLIIFLILVCYSFFPKRNKIHHDGCSS
ncbi:MAG: exosortase K [Syntrophaceae bacterium]